MKPAAFVYLNKKGTNRARRNPVIRKGPFSFLSDLFGQSVRMDCEKIHQDPKPGRVLLQGSRRP